MDIIKAMNSAFSLGQTHWQQSDSESYKQNAKADETRTRFVQLRTDVEDELTQLREQNSQLRFVNNVLLDLLKHSECNICGGSGVIHNSDGELISACELCETYDEILATIKELSDDGQQ
jgi:hypothetical protein